jgi:gliding motility-associated-like protein
MVCTFDYANANFTYSPTDATIVNPEIQFNNLSDNATSFNWNFAGLDSTTSTSPLYSFPNSEPGSYEVCLSAINANGCNDTVCRTIVIHDEFLIFVPNAFTPDGDEFNEEFIPVVSGFEAGTFELFIFNRWGELIFESSDPNNGWNGSFKGSPVKEDVYVWKIRVKDQISSEKKEFTGHVTLLR